MMSSRQPITVDRSAIPDLIKSCALPNPHLYHVIDQITEVIPKKLLGGFLQPSLEQNWSQIPNS